VEQHTDLRGWLSRVEEVGELETVRRADWELELGAIADEAFHITEGPAVMFDDIKDYAPGFRTLVNAVGSFRRIGLTLGIEPTNDAAALLELWRNKRKRMEKVAPRSVDTGPLMQNVQRGSDVDVTMFPAPLWHEQDGGRYLGTGCVVFTKDPSNGWVNLGCYRVMVHDRQHISVMTSPGRHATTHRKLWAEKGQPTPIAISFGHDPLLFVAAYTKMGWGQSEYEFAGAIKGRGIDVLSAPVTGLPVPAGSELVMEGFITDEMRPEGPFGEWLGYYASGSRPEQLIKVDGVYFRDDPVVLGQPPMKPPSGYDLATAFFRSADAWEQLEGAGLGGITKVWSHQLPGVHVVSIRQQYGGHAVQVGQVLAHCQAIGYLNRIVIVVDDDIDAADLTDVMWAVSTRADPDLDYHVDTNCWSSALDPLVSPEKRERGDFTNSRVIIDATRPYAWRGRFPAVNEVSPALQKQVREKWHETLERLRAAASTRPGPPSSGR
jgi:UbiD family decarboxylase